MKTMILAATAVGGLFAMPAMSNAQNGRLFNLGFPQIAFDKPDDMKSIG